MPSGPAPRSRSGSSRARRRPTPAAPTPRPTASSALGFDDRPLDDASLAAYLRPRRSRTRSARRPPSAAAGRRCDRRPAVPRRHSDASEVASLRWADVDLSDGNDVVVTVCRSKPDPTCAAAVRCLHAATAPKPADSVVGLGIDQINRRFADACAAASLKGRRTSPDGRAWVLAVELTARGASTHAIQLAGGWRSPRWSRATPRAVAVEDGAVARFFGQRRVAAVLAPVGVAYRVERQRLHPGTARPSTPPARG